MEGVLCREPEPASRAWAGTQVGLCAVDMLLHCPGDLTTAIHGVSMVDQVERDAKSNETAQVALSIIAQLNCKALLTTSDEI